MEHMDTLYVKLKGSRLLRQIVRLFSFLGFSLFFPYDLPGSTVTDNNTTSLPCINKVALRYFKQRPSLITYFAYH